MIPLIIPSYEPDERLLQLLNTLRDYPFGPVLLVNDGSSPAYQTFFDRAKELLQEKLILLSHEVNRGKGRALKTAFAYVLEHFPDAVIDVKRCRLARIYSLPLKVKGIKGYELLGDDETNIEAAPQNLAGVKKLSVDGKATKNKQWERRLLDLSLKNTLLHFQPEKMVLHVLSADPDSILKALFVYQTLIFNPKRCHFV